MTPRFGVARMALAMTLLAAAVLVAHGWCLNDGSVLDDHWHQKGLREHGWTGRELMRTLEIEPAKWMHLWWQTETVRWEYARPLFILAMKTVYTVLGGSDPWSLHAYSLLLHWVAAVLVVRLVWLLTGHRGWSAFAGLLFVVYPHAVMTVQWPSAQNVVQQLVFTLAALLCYLRATRLDQPGVLWPGMISERAIAPGGRTSKVHASLDGPAIHNGWLALTLFWWILALFTRENALVLPAIFAAFEFSFRGWSGLRRRVVTLAAFGVLCTIFVAWRVSVVTQGMPDVYIRRPDGDVATYLAWCAAKVLHYLVTSVWLAPMAIGPTGRYNPWTDVTGDCLLMIGILGVVTVLYLVATRGVRGRWIWPVWIVLSVLPVIPVVATPHSGYLGGVGFVVGVALAAAAVEARRKRWVHWAGSIAVFYLITMSVLTMLYRWQWSGIIAAERLLPAAVALDPPPAAAREVFFINLPFVNVYNKPHLVEALGTDYSARNVHILTFAPQPVMINQRVTIEQTSEHAFEVSVEGQPMFSRLLGRFLLEGFAARGPFRSGERFESAGFSVVIVDADDSGVRRLRFRFPRPISDPGYAFYLSSIDFPAARLRFPRDAEVAAQPRFEQIRRLAEAARPGAESDAGVDAAIRRLESGDSSAMATLLDAVEGVQRSLHPAEETSTADRALAAIRRVGGAVAQATGASVMPLLLGPAVPVDDLAPPPRIRPPAPPPPPPDLTPLDVGRIRSWWLSSVDDALLTAVWTRRGELAPFVKDREEVPHARQWAALLLRTDLYMTGHPFDDPRPRD